MTSTLNDVFNQLRTTIEALTPSRGNPSFTYVARNTNAIGSLTHRAFNFGYRGLRPARTRGTDLVELEHRFELTVHYLFSGNVNNIDTFERILVDDTVQIFAAIEHAQWTSSGISEVWVNDVRRNGEPGQDAALVFEMQALVDEV